jgi:RHS repeat-associated protein
MRELRTSGSVGGLGGNSQAYPTPYGAVTITVGGTPQGTDPLNQHWTFTGRFFDEETGFYYYRARMYDPAMGRFLQRDPLGYAEGPNLYTYVDSAPTILTDSTGRHIDRPGPWNGPGGQRGPFDPDDPGPGPRPGLPPHEPTPPPTPREQLIERFIAATGISRVLIDPQRTICFCEIICQPMLLWFPVGTPASWISAGFDCTPVSCETACAADARDAMTRLNNLKAFFELVNPKLMMHHVTFLSPAGVPLATVTAPRGSHILCTHVASCL